MRMARCFKVEKCTSCPHHDHSGAFTQGGAIPLCRAMPDDSKYGCRMLPWEGSINKRNNTPTRVWTDRIPSWCPLLEVK